MQVKNEMTVLPADEPMPVKTEMTVLPADEPKQLKLGWKVFEYTGAEIHRVEEGKATDQTIKEKDGLHDGMEVEAWNGIWTVRIDEGKDPYLDAPRTIGTLVFGEDDRECWVCGGLINKRLIAPPKKVLIVG